MSKNTYRATLNYYDSSWGWKNEGTASQGKWDGTGVRTGVMYFAGLSALKGKIINSVTLTVSTGETGYGLATTKTAYIYNSASQGGINTSLNANHKTGNCCEYASPSTVLPSAGWLLTGRCPLDWRDRYPSISPPARS